MFQPVENYTKVIKVSKKKFSHELEQVPIDDTEWNRLEYCLMCCLTTDDDRLLVCDAFNYVLCHTYCVGLESIPIGD